MDIQKQSGYSTCGMYSKKQLKHWGRNPPNQLNSPCTRALLLVSSIMASVVPLEAKSTPCPDVKTVQVEKKAFSKIEQTVPQDSLKPIIFSGVVRDSSTGDPLIGANVFCVGTNYGQVTDLEGKYRIDVSEIWEDWNEKKIEFSYTGYRSLQIPTSDFPEGKNDMKINLSDKGVPAISFYVVYKASFPKRVWWKIKSIFR